MSYNIAESPDGKLYFLDSDSPVLYHIRPSTVAELRGRERSVMNDDEMWIRSALSHWVNYSEAERNSIYMILRDQFVGRPND